MQLPYFYFPDIANEKNYTLNEDTSKHIAQVLRMQVGEQLQLTDGKGNLITCTIEDNHRKHCTVKVDKQEFFPKADKSFSIAISPLKNNSRFEWFLEKVTELGINEIVPLICERTEKQNIKPERLKSIVVSAMLQSRQVWLPLLHEQKKFEKFVSNATHGQKFIAHCLQGEKKLLQQSIDNNKLTHLLLIGPEGDFTTKEIMYALQIHFEPVSLGHTRLRTETAGIAGAVIMAQSCL